MSVFDELKRRNVLRAGVLYAGAVWALAQGIAQLGPSVGAPEWVTRWFLVAAVIGFPFWIAFAWFYEFTPQGLKRESEIDPADSVAHSTGRKLDFWIIGVLAVAVVLLLTNQFVVHRDGDAAPIPDKSVAVLPLANESGDKGDQYFSDGLSEDLITALSQFSGLKVISRNSSFQFRDTKDDARTIGAKLGVAHLLEGSVRRAGEEVRISAELVNAADGSTLWSQRYDRPYKDLFALQDDITHAVATTLKTKLLESPATAVQSDRPPSGNLAAWNAYSRGTFASGLGTPVDYRKAIDFYSQATALDPGYARAYAAMAQSWTILGATFLGGEEQRHAYAKARVAAEQALQLDPDMAAAHAARGLLLVWADFDSAGAEVEYRRALEFAPNDGPSKFWLGNLSSRFGHPQQAIALIRQVIANDPRNGTAHYWLGWNLAAVGQLEEAEQALHKAIELVPTNPFFPTGLAIIQIQRKQARAALATAQQEPTGPWREFALTLALQVGGDRVAADAALKSLIARNADAMAYQIAEAYGLRKEPDNVFTWLDHAWANRDPGIGRLLTDPFILPYKNDPRFAAFCKKVGLPTTISAKSMP
ncbi:MAG TPA: tetratricopeptide repeat protein [Rhodanobacter sp.]|nr:tetratricopeptide repeat protein [Rhodanobacter sp.]